MKLKVKIQRHLALAHLAEDDGEFAFVLCRRGLEKLVGRRLNAGETVVVEVTGELIDDGAGK